jgi:DNA (cytosine-5)-methyltransferase 1
VGRRKPSHLSLTDLFCGAGGASIGAELAGVKLALGVNHWDRAVATHAENFPHAAHDCRNISDTHPSRYGSTHLLWASPECTTLSQARGKKRNYTGQLPLDAEFEPLPTEAEEKSRVHPLDVVRFAEYHGYEAIVVENVVEECLWGLLPAWFGMMEALGYAHRTLYLNSMFFGVPQSRDRVYFVFWKKGNRAPDLDFRPSSWCPACEAIVEGVQSFKPRCAPTRRYGPRQQYIYVCPRCTERVLPFVAPALIAIDWSVRGERIGDRKAPLVAATMARIQAGIDRYWNRPVVLDVMRAPKYRDATTSPLPTQTGRQSLALYIPLIAHLRGTLPPEELVPKLVDAAATVDVDARRAEKVGNEREQAACEAVRDELIAEAFERAGATPAEPVCTDCGRPERESPGLRRYLIGSFCRDCQAAKLQEAR